MARPQTHPELDSGVPAEGHHRYAKRSHHDPHRNVRDVLWIVCPALKLKGAVVAGQKPGEPDEHLAQRGVDVKVELALEVVRPELAKVRLVPDDEARLADLVKAGPTGEEGVDDGREVLQVLKDELALGIWRFFRGARGGELGCGRLPVMLEAGEEDV
jgi:hypothetical protein